MDWFAFIGLGIGVAGLQVQLITKIAELNGRITRIESQSTSLVESQKTQIIQLDALRKNQDNMISRIIWLEARSDRHRKGDTENGGT